MQRLADRELTSMVQSEGRFATDRPARYAAQLAKHLGHRLDTAWEDPDGFIRIPDGSGSCRLLASGEALELFAQGVDAAALDRIKDVVKRHLERFAERERLTLEWAD